MRVTSILVGCGSLARHRLVTRRCPYVVAGSSIRDEQVVQLRFCTGILATSSSLDNLIPMILVQREGLRIRVVPLTYVHYQAPSSSPT